MTSSYWPFVLYVSVFVALIAAASSQITTKVMKAYPCTVSETEEGIVILIDAAVAADFDTLYLYTDKNQDFHRLTAVSVSQGEDSASIQVLETELLRELASGFGNEPKYVEIPVGEITLLRRILPMRARDL